MRQLAAKGLPPRRPRRHLPTAERDRQAAPLRGRRRGAPKRELATGRLSRRRQAPSWVPLNAATWMSGSPPGDDGVTAKDLADAIDCYSWIFIYECTDKTLEKDDAKKV